MTRMDAGPVRGPRKSGIDPRVVVRAIERIGQFFREGWYTGDSFEGWPGLPKRRGQAPTRAQANEFFLGCCIDYMTRAQLAWDNARRFCHDVVPPGQLPLMWQWIAEHSEASWDQKRAKYGLHRFPEAIVASIELLVRYAGSSAAMSVVSGRRTSNSSSGSWRTTSKWDQRCPAWVVGALRDHRLVTLKKSDFKPDRHVCRLMRALGLAKSDRPQAVLAAANALFDDPWMADIALYHLGADYRVTSARGFWAIHDTITAWTRLRSTVQKRIESAIGRFCSDHREWSYEPFVSAHWAGAYVYTTKGPLSREMDNDDVWLWIGVGFDGDIVLSLEVGGHGRLFAPKRVRTTLTRLGLKRDEARTAHLETWWGQRSVEPHSLIDRAYLLPRIRRAAETLKTLTEGLGGTRGHPSH